MSRPVAGERAVEVRIFGLVQGVFYRARCVEQAMRFGVTGWVANEPDGSVSGYFEGSPNAVDALIGWCRSGPPRARVDHVQVIDSTPHGAKGFHAR